MEETTMEQLRREMMDALGNHRQDGLPLAGARPPRDDHDFGARSDGPSTPLPANANNDVAKLWASAINEGRFNDLEKFAVEGLDDLGGSRPWANNKVYEKTKMLFKELESKSKTSLRFVPRPRHFHVPETMVSKLGAVMPVGGSTRVFAPRPKPVKPSGAVQLRPGLLQDTASPGDPDGEVLVSRRVADAGGSLFAHECCFMMDQHSTVSVQGIVGIKMSAGFAGNMADAILLFTSRGQPQRVYDMKQCVCANQRGNAVGVAFLKPGGEEDLGILHFPTPEAAAEFARCTSIINSTLSFLRLREAAAGANTGPSTDVVVDSRARLPAAGGSAAGPPPAAEPPLPKNEPTSTRSQALDNSQQTSALAPHERGPGVGPSTGPLPHRPVLSRGPAAASHGPATIHGPPAATHDPALPTNGGPPARPVIPFNRFPVRKSNAIPAAWLADLDSSLGSSDVATLRGFFQYLLHKNPALLGNASTVKEAVHYAIVSLANSINTACGHLIEAGRRDTFQTDRRPVAMNVIERFTEPFGPIRFQNREVTRAIPHLINKLVNHYAKGLSLDNVPAMGAAGPPKNAVDPIANGDRPAGREDREAEDDGGRGPAASAAARSGDSGLPRKPAQTIKYGAEQILGLRKNASEAPEALGAATFLPPRTPSKAGRPPCNEGAAAAAGEDRQKTDRAAAKYAAGETTTANNNMAGEVTTNGTAAATGCPAWSAPPRNEGVAAVEEAAVTTAAEGRKKKKTDGTAARPGGLAVSMWGLHSGPSRANGTKADETSARTTATDGPASGEGGMAASGRGQFISSPRNEGITVNELAVGTSAPEDAITNGAAARDPDAIPGGLSASIWSQASSSPPNGDVIRSAAHNVAAATRDPASGDSVAGMKSSAASIWGRNPGPSRNEGIMAVFSEAVEAAAAGRPSPSADANQTTAPAPGPGSSTDAVAVTQSEILGSLINEAIRTAAGGHLALSPDTGRATAPGPSAGAVDGTQSGSGLAVSPSLDPSLVADIVEEVLRNVLRRSGGRDGLARGSAGPQSDPRPVAASQPEPAPTPAPAYGVTSGHVAASVPARAAPPVNSSGIWRVEAPVDAQQDEDGQSGLAASVWASR